MTDSTPQTGHDDPDKYDDVIDRPSQAEGEDTGVEAPEPQDPGVEENGKPSQAEGEDDASSTT